MSRLSFNNDGTEEEIERTAFFTNTVPRQLLSAEGIQEVVTSIIDEINNKVTEYISLGSGYRVKNIVSMEIKTFEFQPFHNARANGYLKLPFRAQGVVNFSTERNCFKYSVVAGLHWEDVKGTVTQRKLRSLCTWEKFFPLYDFTDAEKDVQIHDIDKFEARNKIGVTVYTHHDDEIVYARKSRRKFPKSANLFLIRKGEESHFAVIVNLDKFLNHGRGESHFYCSYCGKSFVKKDRQIIHMFKCQPESNLDEEDQTEHVYPEPGTFLSFKRHELTLPQTYVGFFDFETYSAAVAPAQAHHGSSTEVLCEYKPASFSMCIVEYRHEGLPRVIGVEYYDGDDVMEVFFKKLFYWSRTLVNTIRRSNNKACPTKEQLQKHWSATACELCDRPFMDPKLYQRGSKEFKEALRQQRCWHHYHQGRGQYLMTICSVCNLRITHKNELTWVAHNLTGIDLTRSNVC